MTNQVTYDDKTKLFHWISAALILSMWLLGQSLDFLPDGEPIITAASVHYVVGAVLTLLLLFRISWKFTKGTKLPNALPGIWGAMAKSVHYSLYVLLALTLLMVHLLCGFMDTPFLSSSKYQNLIRAMKT